MACKQYYIDNKEIILAKQKIYRQNNKDLISKRKKLYVKRNYKRIKEYQREWHIKYNHNITIEEYNRMFIKQEGKCMICNTHQNNLTKPLFIDHDHITGKIRGLLCGNCNSVLGHANDNKEILKDAIEYLEKFKN